MPWFGFTTTSAKIDLMPINDAEMCACGKPLHYTDRQKRQYVDEMVARHGPTVKVTCGTRSWLVPRHFIALHGLISEELPSLAKRHGFAEITEGKQP